jgi:hypothetical protein
MAGRKEARVSEARWRGQLRPSNCTENSYTGMRTVLLSVAAERFSRSRRTRLSRFERKREGKSRSYSGPTRHCCARRWSAGARPHGRAPVVSFGTPLNVELMIAQCWSATNVLIVSATVPFVSTIAPNVRIACTIALNVPFVSATVPFASMIAANVPFFRGLGGDVSGIVLGAHGCDGALVAALDSSEPPKSEADGQKKEGQGQHLWLDANRSEAADGVWRVSLRTPPEKRDALITFSAAGGAKRVSASSIGGLDSHRRVAVDPTLVGRRRNHRLFAAQSAKAGAPYVGAPSTCNSRRRSRDHRRPW